MRSVVDITSLTKTQCFDQNLNICAIVVRWILILGDMLSQIDMVDWLYGS